MKNFKRFLAVLLVLTMLSGAVSVSAISDADFVAPTIGVAANIIPTTHRGLTDGTSYVLGEGTEYQINVTTDFIPTTQGNRPDPNNPKSQKYITVHNTGNYGVTATAAANHTYIKSDSAVSSQVSWHFTCGNDGIYQSLPLNEKGWHTGSNNGQSVTDANNNNCIGIETCVNGFPATSTSGGEQWNSDEMYEWYANQYDKTATYLGMLVASMCLQTNFNPYTQIIQHNDISGKNCPMQMRYVFGTTGTFVKQGTYYKVFWARMIAFYEAMGGTYTSTDTVKNIFYTTPSATQYQTGTYTSASAVNAYSAGATSTALVGTFSANSSINVTQVSYNWGKTTVNGNAAWVYLPDLTYVNAYQTGYYRANGSLNVYSTASASGTVVATVAAGDILTCSAVSSSWGNVETAGGQSGWVSLASTTRVYALTVANSSAYGSDVKYYAAGETVSLSANAAPTEMMFDKWIVTSGGAAFANRDSSTTSMTMKAADTTVTAKYKTIEYTLTVQSGIGNGSYLEGTTVNIKASTVIGKKFIGWQLVSGSGTFYNAAAISTTFTMNAENTVIKANYIDFDGFYDENLTNYSGGRLYTVTKGGGTPTYRNTTQGDDAFIKLTDGAYATSEYVDSSANAQYAKFVTYTGTSSVYAFTFNLGSNREVSAVALRDICISDGTSFGSYDDSLVSVAYSTNGSTYTEVGNLTDSASYSTWKNGGATVSSSKMINHLLEFDSVTAKYIKVSLKSMNYLFALSEIEVLGGTTYELTVQNGTGGGRYTTGKAVTITADAPAAGYSFSHWQIVTGSGTFADSTSAATIFTTTAGAATISAIYTSEGGLNLTAEALNSGNYSLDTSYLKGFSAATSASQIKALFDGAVTITDANGGVVADNATVGTGYIITNGAVSVEAVLSGDTTGDGVISVADYISVKRHIKRVSELSGAYVKAADQNNDNVVGSADIISIKMTIKG